MTGEGMFGDEIDSAEAIQDNEEQEAQNARILKAIENPPLRLPKVTFSAEGVAIAELAELIRALRGL